MSAKHTPAPWIVKKWETETYKGCEIMNLEGVSVSYLSNLNWEANAKLIAAAPELLEALQNLTTAANMFLAACGEEVYNSQFKHIEKAQTAIKKATDDNS